MVITLSEAAQEARSMSWASSTVSVGFLVKHFGPEPILYHFNKAGDVIGYEEDGEVIYWSKA